MITCLGVAFRLFTPFASNNFTAGRLCLKKKQFIIEVNKSLRCERRTSFNERA